MLLSSGGKGRKCVFGQRRMAESGTILVFFLKVRRRRRNKLVCDRVFYVESAPPPVYGYWDAAEFLRGVRPRPGGLTPRLTPRRSYPVRCFRLLLLRFTFAVVRARLVVFRQCFPVLGYVATYFFVVRVSLHRVLYVCTPPISMCRLGQ